MSASEDKLDVSGKFWGKHRTLRILFHPLLLLTSVEYRTYRFLSKPKEKRKNELAKHADLYMRALDLSIPEVDREDVIGRDEELNLLLYSFRYNVLNLKSLREVKARPSKSFIIQGSSGVGKSFLANAFARMAYREALEEGVMVSVDRLKASEILSEFMGHSTAKLGERLNRMLSVPTILIIDEAQSLTTKGSTEGASKGDLGVMREHQSMESEMLQALDTLSSNKNVRSMVIFLSDQFEYLLDTIRRRSELIDLDANITKSKLVELSRRLCAKYEIDLDPEKIVDIVSRELYSFGKKMTTFNDITKSFDFVVREAERPLREGASTTISKITYDNFLTAAKTVSAYEFEETTQTAKSSKVRIRPTETYADVGGLRGVKEQVVQEMSLILNRNVSQRLHYKLSRGFLFYGKSGSGKTLLAKAIANETNVPFYYISASSLLSKYVGSTEKNLRDVFTTAKREPNGAIIFCDELDAIGRARGGEDGMDGARASIIAELLTQLDGFDTAGGRLIFIGATNMRDVLDPALLDRLSRQIEFTYPKTAVERKEVIAVHLKRAQDVLARGVTLNDIYNIFLRRTFSPRVISDTVDLALRFRAMEILYAVEAQVASKERLAQMNATFADAIQRMHDIAPCVDYTAVSRGLDEPQAWPLTLKHFEKALDMITNDETYREMLEMQRIYIPETPEVGKAYGLAVLVEKADRGIIAVVTTNVYRSLHGRGRVEVFGDAGRGPKESAQMVVSYIRRYIPEIVDYDVLVHIISAAEGSAEGDKVAISGPSLGQVLGVSIISRVLKVIRGVDLPIHPDIVITGKIEQVDGISGWVGGVHPKDTAAKIEIAAAEKFKRVSIPAGQKEKLEADYGEYVEFLRGEGTEILGARNVIENLGYATKTDPEKILALLEGRTASSKEARQL